MGYDWGGQNGEAQEEEKTTSDSTKSTSQQPLAFIVKYKDDGWHEKNCYYKIGDRQVDEEETRQTTSLGFLPNDEDHHEVSHQRNKHGDDVSDRESNLDIMWVEPWWT